MNDERIAQRAADYAHAYAHRPGLLLEMILVQIQLDVLEDEAYPYVNGDL